MPTLILENDEPIMLIELLPKSPFDVGDVKLALSPDGYCTSREVTDEEAAQIRQGGAVPDKWFVIQIVFDDHDSYYKIREKDLDEVMKIEDLEDRFQALLDKSVDTSVGSSYDVDMTLVHDGQDLVECWSDFEQDLYDAD